MFAPLTILVVGLNWALDDQPIEPFNVIVLSMKSIITFKFLRSNIIAAL